MFDFRYHIISLTAVFLALGVGIVLGTMVVEKGVVSEQQKALVSRIEKDFEALRSENRQAAARLELAEQFADEIVPMMVANKLTGQNVALVVTTSMTDEVGRGISETIQKAGARVTSTTTIQSDVGLGDKEKAAKIEALIAEATPAGGPLKARLLTEVAKDISTGQQPKLLQDLAGYGSLKLNGVYDVPVQAVVVIGGTDGKVAVDDIDAAFIKGVVAYNVPVVGVETSTVKNSYMNGYQGLGISTVDDIDLVAGRIALILVLSGQSGHYGIKPTAKQMLPAGPR